MATSIMKRALGLVVASLIVLSINPGCSNYQIPGKVKPEPQANLCEDCHTDYARLIEVHTPDTAAPVGGCGGDAPHYEPYDRVFLGGDGYDSFIESGHYGIGCTGCHNGDGNADDKYEAHSGDWIASPSMAYGEKCAMCHETETEGFVTSLHNGTGQKRAVAMRAGLEGAHQFDQLPAHQIEGYNAKCSHCHGTCGNCHVVRPKIAGGGLASGHNFNKTPSMQKVCVKCHASRGGHAYLGVAPGTKPDLHLTEMGYHCLDCHDGAEMHGDGAPVEQRYDYSELPECTGCHPGRETSNDYHEEHYTDFNCQVCHSQIYNNCGACHVKDGHAEFGAYMDFKIALNTLPDLKDYEFAVVRRTLAHPDNWVGYGDDLAYSNFDALPTYNYTSPHNILKWTDRTDTTGTAGSCTSNCHIRNEGGVLVNSELYLWRDSLETWEIGATEAYTVDGELPEYWFIAQ